MVLIADDPSRKKVPILVMGTTWDFQEKTLRRRDYHIPPHRLAL